MAQAPDQARPTSNVARFFFRGLMTLLPIVLTMVVFGLAYNMVTTYVTGPINRSIYWSLERNAIGWEALSRLDIDPYHSDYLDTVALPAELQNLASRLPDGYEDTEFLAALEAYRDDRASFFRDLDELCIRSTALRRSVEAAVPPIVGVVVSLLLVIWLGWLVGGFLGRRVVHRVDRAFHAIPLVRTVYPYSKQLVEFFFAEKKIDFDTVVAVPYPSARLWSLAFVTNRAPKTVMDHVGDPMVAPMTGYTLFLRSKDIIPLQITVDEALRITMSGGVLMPPGEQHTDGVDLGEVLQAASDRESQE